MKQYRLILTTVLLLVFAATDTIQAQNVTIKATNGSMIASTPQGDSQYDTFYSAGGFATWQHKQLSMVMTVSDEKDLTSSGQFSNPANNLFSDGSHIQVGKGYNKYPLCYLTVSLPKGYRFEGYTITFSKPGGADGITKSTQSGDDITFNDDNGPSGFGETNASFEYLDNSDDSETYAEVSKGGNAQVIARTAMNGDMGNVLYFKLLNPNNNTENRALITLESAEFQFTAEEDYAVNLATPGDVKCVSAIDIPFATSKVDYGSIESRTYNGATRMAYSSANVKDLTANFTMYEAASVVAGTDFDGSTGNVVDYKEGSISVENGYYRIGAEDAATPGTTEHIYYIETPSYVLLSDRATKNPVGYRIVSANVDYKYGPTNKYSNTPKEYDTFYISYSTSGWFSTTYYMNNSGGATTNVRDRALWFIDSEGYIRTGVNGGTYLTVDEYSYTTTTTNKAEALKCAINDGYISTTQGGTTYWIRRTTSWGSTYFRFQNNTGNLAKRTISGTTTINEGIRVVGTATNTYTLKVYDKTGTSAEPVTVNSTNSSGSVTIAGMNNDALKIGVIGTGLIKVTLTLQALDPYLDRMTVVCSDEQQAKIRMEQYFTASDFSVNGGQFHFSIPSSCDQDNIKITFEDLKSQYFDETYPGGATSHTSRLNFVKSLHYNAFGTSNNNLYTNRSEASDAQLERRKVGTVGNKAFKFNNAADLTNGNGILTEYPFTLEKYSADPNLGNFSPMIFTPTDRAPKTGYVFTTDETRYNIGTATAVQHRTYAYYEMLVSIDVAEYEPKVEFTKIYNSTFYVDNNQEKTDAFWGVKVTATDTGGDAGYASTDAIFERISTILNETRKDDANNTDLPASAKQILYLDFSELAGVIQVTTEQQNTMENYLATCAANCLIFLPEGATAPNNNVAYKMESGGFHAANNIIITDKHPFFSPYDIRVSATNYAEYQRQITHQKNGMETLCTVILPFSINLKEQDGKYIHNNNDNTGSFYLHQINETNVLAMGTSAVDYEYGFDGHFGNPRTTYLGAADQTAVAKANVPYIVEVVEAPGVANNLPFIARVNGATVTATPLGSSESARGIFTGETASASVDGNPINFTHTGTFRGKTIANARTAGEKVFYFSSNLFLNSTTLVSGLTLYILPFRSFYSYEGNASGVSSFRFVFGENENESSDISALKRNADFAVIPGKGSVTLMAKVDNNVNVISANGTTVEKVALKSGEIRTIQLPAGIYLINGTKIVVR